MRLTRKEYERQTEDFYTLIVLVCGIVFVGYQFITWLF